MNRRQILLLIVASGLSAAGVGPAWAQDPRGTIAQKEARTWLASTDRGDAAASWGASGKQFQNAISADKWGDSLKQVRPPLGAVVERSILSTEFPKSFPGAPDGEYALLVFRTSFANKIDSRETVTLQHEADGAWRVVGYYVK
jgi:Protein of unknown function (DUF4019)